LSKKLVDASKVHDGRTPKGHGNIVEPSQAAKYKLYKESKQEFNVLVSAIGKRFLKSVATYDHCHFYNTQ